ncbi:MAG: class I tRNA ligase family protein, partial [Anaerolineales bacterium]
LQAAQERDLPVLVTVAGDGTFIPEVRPWSGRFVKDADPLIMQDLQARGLLLQAGTNTHTYPFCWRCDIPLIYYARSTWYIRTSQLKDRLLALNQRIHWVPEHIKDGRFGDWLENNVDWALGRERYWGTPLPIWECEFCHRQVCIGSVAELADLSGQDLSGLDLHRPFVDEVLFPCPDCSPTSGAQMQRVPELIDVWFDSGSMPVAQWHYPFENQDRFEQQFPADFICEAVDQTRGWFYSLHAISTLLFDEEAFKNVISLGLILDENGQKMSKTKGNVIDPWEVINQHGADAFRWYLYTASPPGQERRFSADLVGEVVRGFTLTLWNVYSFFITYANLDDWEPVLNSHSDNLLDLWLQSELESLTAEVTAALEAYDVTGATRPLMGFVDHLSKWYLRRSRRRFWKSEADQDKQSAYDTLYRSLVRLSHLLAPCMPFLAEELYQNLVCSWDGQAPESVHLSIWPEANPAMIDPELNEEMRLVMKLASLGHAARNQAGVKVRQPLSEVAFSVGSREEAQVLVKFEDLLADELNVRQVRLLGSAGEAVSYSLKPLPQQLGRKYKSLFPKVSAAILDLDTEGAARALLDGRSLLVAVDGKPYTILPEDVEVRAEARAGYTISAEGPYLAALMTDLTPELVLEGLAREFVRRVQQARKEAGLEIADRIHIRVDASLELARAIAAHRQYIMGEVLALSLDAGAPLEEATWHNALFEFDGEQAAIGMRKAA